MSAEVEKWRVSTIEGVFETDLETLKQWIHEGCVLPTDKVSKGNLNWIDAGLAPMLRATFNGEAPAPPPAATESSLSDTSVTPLRDQHPVTPLPDQHPVTPLPDQHLQNEPDDFELHLAEIAPLPVTRASASSTDVCANHPAKATKHICRGCANSFCEECPKFVGTSKIAICPLCGHLFGLYEKQRSKAVHQEFQGSGFGPKHLGRALRYPLQHKVAVLFGAAFYGFCLLAGFRGRVLAS